MIEIFENDTTKLYSYHKQQNQWIILVFILFSSPLQTHSRAGLWWLLSHLYRKAFWRQKKGVMISKMTRDVSCHFLGWALNFYLNGCHTPLFYLITFFFFLLSILSLFSDEIWFLFSFSWALQPHSLPRKWFPKL